MQRFTDIDASVFLGKSIFLDIDGTLGADGVTELTPQTLATIRALSEHNQVLLCSNKRLPERDQALAHAAGIEAIVSPYKKPFRRVIAHLPASSQKRVVIGDKFLTDGLFAFSIGAEFLKVARVTGNDALTTRLLHVIDDMASLLFNLIVLSRPSHLIKNGLIFVPLFFARDIFNAEAFFLAFVAFVSFSLFAASVYVTNDIRDLEKDQAHPEKRLRPIAAGLVPVPVAVAYTFFLVLVSVCLSAFLVPAVLPFLVTYLALNALYTGWLKDLPVFDIGMVASLYVLRILVGGAATATFISSWLILSVFFLALFIIVGKRLAEAKAHQARDVLAHYPLPFLEGLTLVSAALVLVSYATYTILGVPSEPELVYSNILVVVGVFKYLHVLYTKTDGEFPIRILLRDWGMLAIVVSWVLFMGYAFYL